jgi:putative transcriptional regulator
MKNEKHSELFLDLKESLEEAIAYKRGEKSDVRVIRVERKIPQSVEVKAIRAKLGLTQEQFTRFGFSLSAIRHWEAKRRTPEGAARVLLKLIDTNPNFVLECLEG